MDIGKNIKIEINLEPDDRNRKIFTNFNPVPVRKFKCEFCDKKFLTASDIKRHTATHKGEHLYKEEFDLHYAIHESNHQEEVIASVFNSKTPKMELFDLNRKHKCEYCNKRFMRLQQLKRHRKKHTGENPYECVWCYLKFSRKEDFDIHFAIHEPARQEGMTKIIFFTKKDPPKKEFFDLNRKHKCEYCTKRFTRSYDLKTHKRIHTGETPYECLWCNLKFSQQESLESHIMIHDENCATDSKGTGSINQITNKIIHQLDYYVCDWNGCGRRFLNYSDFISHTIVHTKEYRFQCSFGSNNIEDNSYLMGHIETPFSLENRSCVPASKVRKFECEFCYKKFLSFAHLKRHKPTHKGENPFKCTQCRIKFRSKEDLDIHFTDHETTHLELDANKDKNNLQCEICNKVFSRAWHLNQHKVTHTGEKPFDCPECDKKYSWDGGLYRHFATCHPDKTLMRKENASKSINQTSTRIIEKKLKCEYCNKQFMDLSNLNIHRRTHTGEKPYKCSDCGKRYPSNGTLNIHFKNHHLDRNLVENKLICEYCNKQFMYSYVLKVHRRTHTDEKPYKCSKCDNKYRGRSGLNTHYRTHHINKKLQLDAKRRKSFNHNLIIEGGKGPKIKRSKKQLHNGSDDSSDNSLSAVPYVKCERELRAKQPRLEIDYGEPSDEIGIGSEYKYNINKTVLKTNKAGNQTKYSCRECNIAFYSSKLLEIHERLSHRLALKVDYHVCDWKGCGRRFFNYSNFIFHTAIHMKEYRFQCSFDSKNIELSSHLMGHTETSHLLSNQLYQHRVMKIGRNNKIIITENGSLRLLHGSDSNSDDEIKALQKQKNVNQIPRNISDINWSCYCFVRRLSCGEMERGFIKKKIIHRKRGKSRLELSKCRKKLSKQSLNKHGNSRAIGKLKKTSVIGTKRLTNFQEYSTTQYKTTNMEILDLLPTVKIKKEEPDVMLETQSSAAPYNICCDVICKEELMLFD